MPKTSFASSLPSGGAAQAEVEEERPANVLAAAAAGTSDGLKLYLNVVAMRVAVVASVGLINAGLGVLSGGGDDPLTLQRLFGYVFAPVAWMMGVEWGDCMNFGTLLGTKVAVNEFIAFSEMQALEGTLSPRSYTMAAYARCGFANFASVGIQIGGIGALAEGRRADLSRLALRAMRGGAFASWMTATIAGMFL